MIFNELREIIEYNLDIERKQMLFNKKMDELKNLFITLSYDELKKLTFDTAIIDPTSSVIDDNNNTYTPEVVKEETKKSKKSKKQMMEKQIEEDEDDYLESEVIEGDVNNIQPVNLN